MLFGGAGQFVYVVFPLSSLPLGDGSTFAVWQNISFGVGLAITSPVAAVVFAMASERVGDNHSALAAALRTFMAVGASIFIVVSIVSGLLLEDSVDRRSFTAIILFSSLFSQLIASVQRTYLASQSQWGKLCLHLTVDGVTKAALTFLVLKLFVNTYVLMIISVVATVTAVIATRQKLPLRDTERLLHLERRNLKRFFSALSAASGVQIFASGPPVFAEVANWSHQDIYSLSLSAQVLRMGITMSTPILIPMITNYAASLHDEDDHRISMSRHNSERKLLGFSLIWFLGLTFTIALYKQQRVITLEALEFLNFRLLAAVSLVQLALMFGDFYQQLSLQGRDERSSLGVWWLAIALVIVFWATVGASVVLIYVVSALVLLLLAVALRLRISKIRLFPVQ